MNGVFVDTNVNADQAQIVGAKIIKSKVGKYIETHSFKKDQIKPMSSRAALNIGDNAVHIDPELLFQRLIATVPCQEDLKDLFSYELCSYPSSVFDSSASPRQPTKFQLADK